MRSLLVLFALGLCTTASAKPPVAAPVAVVTMSPEAQAALKGEAETLWSERSDPEKLKQSLAKYEQLFAANPTDRDVGMHLVRGWYFLGDGHLIEKEQKLEVWEKAIAWGNKCLAANADYAALLQKGDEDPASASRSFKKEDVPCIYWTSSALGKWAKASGIAVTLRHLPTVKAYMTRVGELDPQFYYSGPDRYWGAYYSAIPSFAGQDLAKSKEYFDKALASNPTFLGTHVLVAAEWATKKQDRETFNRELNWVLAQDPGMIPEVRPEAEAEQRKAKAILASADEYFAN